MNEVASNGAPRKETSERYLIDNAWMTSEMLAESLNDYYISFGETYEEITTNIPPADEATHPVSLGELKKIKN